MKKIFFAILLSLFTISVWAQDNLPGIWKTDKDNTLVKIEKQDGLFIGKVISSDDKDVTPGTVVIKDTKIEKGILKGQLYLFKKKSWFQATFKMEGNKLKVTGKWTIFSHSVLWTRAENG